MNQINSNALDENDNAGKAKDFSWNKIKEKIINYLKTPIKIMAQILIKEIIQVIKKDAKLYFLAANLMVVIYIMVFIFWLFISITLGYYLYHTQCSTFYALLYVLLFQLLSIVAVLFFIMHVIKKIKSIKILKKIIKEL